VPPTASGWRQVVSAMEKSALLGGPRATCSGSLHVLVSGALGGLLTESSGRAPKLSLVLSIDSPGRPEQLKPPALALGLGTQVAGGIVPLPPSCTLCSPAPFKLNTCRVSWTASGASGLNVTESEQD